MARQLYALLLGAVALSCVTVFSVVAQPVGSPARVLPTPFFNPDPSPTAPYSTSLQNPNTQPDLRVEWSIVFGDGPTQRWNVIGIHLALIPSSPDLYLVANRALSYPLRRRDSIAAVLDLPNLSQFNVTNITSTVFCGHVQHTSDGKLLFVGGAGATPNGYGEGFKDIRVYDYWTDPYSMPTVAVMQDGRWYPSLTLMPDSSIFIQGGTQQANERAPVSRLLERWTPSIGGGLLPGLDAPGLDDGVMSAYPIDEEYLNIVGKNYYPLQFLLPTGDVYVQADDQIRFIMANGTYRNVSGVPPFPADIANEWPRSGSYVMHPLSYEDGYSSTEIIIMGGTLKNATCNYGPPDNRQVAVRTVYRLRIQWTIDAITGEPTYTFPTGVWEEEDMGIPRTGGDPTMLPSGDIVLTSGSQMGCHGGTGNCRAGAAACASAVAPFTGFPRNAFPALWPILYQTDNPAGQRVTVLPATPIARVYHMTAALTLDGHIMITGCDDCRNTTGFYEGTDPAVRSWFSPLQWPFKKETRVEVLKTPFSLDAANRPLITSVSQLDGNTTVPVTYGEMVNITWRSDQPDVTGRVPLVNVTGVSLVAPTAATHSFNGNQRVIKLPIVAYNVPANATEGTITVVMPPTKGVAPPQQYLLFLLNGKTNSRARWVHLQ